MSNRFGKAQKEKAKAVNLIEYLQKVHPNAFVVDGKKTVRLKSHHSVVVVKDGYFRNPSNRHHDTIDFVMTYEHMDCKDAVRKLSKFYDDNTSADLISGSADRPRESKAEKKEFELPFASEEEPDKEQMCQYLLSRGIELNPELEKYIYPTRHDDYVNIVFQSIDCNYAEIRGASNPVPPMRPFKSKAKGSDHDGYFIIGKVVNPDTIFVCEAAIDAISLMILYAGGEPGCAYASIGGAGCTAAIQRISRTYPDAKIIIAFDNDKAGHDAADKLPYEKQFPVYKDWNEDLTRGIN